MLNTLFIYYLRRILSSLKRLKGGIMEDFMSTNEEVIRGQTLMMEESHYVHTINDVVELMITYGQLKVLMDITTRMQEVNK